MRTDLKTRFETVLGKSRDAQTIVGKLEEKSRARAKFTGQGGSDALDAELVAQLESGARAVALDEDGDVAVYTP